MPSAPRPASSKVPSDADCAVQSKVGDDPSVRSKAHDGSSSPRFEPTYNGTTLDPVPPLPSNAALPSSPGARLFAFADAERKQLWFVGELVSLAAFEAAYETWNSLESLGRTEMPDGEVLVADRYHPLMRVHRMHRNWLFLLIFHWRRVLSAAPTSQYPSDVANLSLFGELLLAAFRALGMLPCGPSEFEVSVGFDLVHDACLCSLHRQAEGGEGFQSEGSEKTTAKGKRKSAELGCLSDACTVLVRALFLGERPSFEATWASHRRSPSFSPSLGPSFLGPNSPTCGPLPRANSLSTVSTDGSSLTSSAASLLFSQQSCADFETESSGVVEGEEEDEAVGEAMDEEERCDALDKAFRRTEAPGGMVLLGRGTAVGFGLASGMFGQSLPQVAAAA